MSEHHPTDDAAGDELQVEVSDAPAPPSSASRHAQTPARAAAASPFAARLTRRGRALRASGIAGTVVLALVVVLGSIPATRSAAARLLASFYPTPTPSIVPGSNVFSMLPNPPGTTVLLDGKPLANIPLPGDPRFLMLTPGAHTLEWRNSLYPFRPLSCVLSVPRSAHDTCTLLLPIEVAQPQGSPPLDAPIITDRLSSATLPDDQATALNDAIQVALDSLTADASIAPGDHYLDSNGSAVDTATQPLTAIFQVSPAALASADPCFNSMPTETCHFLGQDCGTLCTYQTPPASAAIAGAQWLVGTPVQVEWMYVANDGSVIASHLEAAGYGIEMALLDVGWDGANWQVQPVFGQHAALQSSDDLACDAAWQPLSQSPVAYVFHPDVSYTVSTQFVSGTQVSDGCVVRMTASSNSTAQVLPGSGTALYLEHCGVLLAASDAAHYLWPNLPQASTAERQVAQQLAAMLD